MMLQLMIYGIIATVFLGLAAAAAEAGLRTYRRPARWVWLVALIGSVALPVVSVVAPELQPAAAGSLVGDFVGGVESLLLPPVVMDLTDTQPWTAKLDLPLAVAWGAATLGLLVLLTWSALRLARERNGWRRVDLGDATAWLSDDVGPAVVGLASSEIVVPAWVLELEREVQRLISLHEEEHVRAGDLPLMIGGLFLVLLAPWNLAMWWQLRRMRLAVEADCDERVLKRGIDVLAYSSLLLEVGGRSARHHLPALAFIKKTSTLARRIHLMTWKPRMRLGRALGATALAITFGVLACETPTVDPIVTESSQAQLVAESMTMVVQDENGGEPLFVIDGVIVQTTSRMVDGKEHISLTLGAEVIDIDGLNIESIEVIKGATAKGLYGDRAANGVIIITTKEGEAEHEHRELEPVVERF